MEERTEILTIEVSAKGLSELLEKEPDSIFLVGLSDKGREHSLVAVERLLNNHLWGE